MKKGLYVIMILLFISCKNKGEEKIMKIMNNLETEISFEKNNSMIEVNTNYKNIIVPNPKKSEIELSTIFKTIKLIKLESEREESRIGKIDKLIVEGENIFILDKEISKIIYVFNKQGKFIRRIGNLGKGPGEYLTPEDFFIGNNKHIYISDLNLRKIIEYNKKGEYLNETNLNGSLSLNARNFMVLEDGTYLFASNNSVDKNLLKETSYNLCKVNDDNKILSRHFRYSNENITIPYSTLNSFMPYKKTYNYLATWNNSVYELTKDSIYLKYKIDFVDEGVPKGFLIRENQKFEDGGFDVATYKAKKVLRDKLDDSKYSFNPKCFLESDTHIFFTYKKQMRSVPVFYDKRSNTVLSSSSVTANKAPLFIASIKSFPVTIDKQQNFYGIIYPYELLEMDKKIENQVGSKNYKKFIQNFPEYSKLLKNIDENDNPIISIINFKQF